MVDYCLLEHPKAVEYASSAQLVKLNALEKCLLIDFLINNNHSGDARSIAKAMELAEKGKIVSGDLYQRLFDTIVTSKALEERRKEAPTAFGSSSSFMPSMQPPMPMGGFGYAPAMDMQFACYSAPPPPPGAFAPMSRMMKMAAPRMASHQMDESY